MDMTTVLLRNACKQIAATTTNEEVRTLARAIEDINLWMDASMTDRRKLFAEVESLKQKLDEIERTLTRR